MVLEKDFTALKLELSVKAKNGVDFIVAASILWSVITVIWMQPNPPGRNALFTLIVGGAMLPLALTFSKIFKTNWKVKSNPLQPLGLWLNFAQLFYFPFLFFVYIKQPQYFIMTYGIITGAHFFPYAWFYNVKAYAIMAGVIAFGCMFIGLNVTVEDLYLIPLFVTVSLVVLSLMISVSYQKNKVLYSGLAAPVNQPAKEQFA
ncbi:hypothetical protein GCM10011375_23090 [Hymenobacter qilianensis]|uniref:Uncharacterized protein n=2 Tax=Hymenobacter qilianensis TaxID=1385715 RepID=A0A7H0GVU6_9BACT|nr:hypothetical protein [Hymenobacter qilianensis]QNP52412.1 hypothetical protein H9L05_01045 [Hymenobacter qilianensis]GGF67453.1 hypothetical protein GCM10011375_23090 [Hymenobacter qilianensis]